MELSTKRFAKLPFPSYHTMLKIIRNGTLHQFVTPRPCALLALGDGMRSARAFETGHGVVGRLPRVEAAPEQLADAIQIWDVAAVAVKAAFPVVFDIVGVHVGMVILAAGVESAPMVRGQSLQPPRLVSPLEGGFVVRSSRLRARRQLARHKGRG